MESERKRSNSSEKVTFAQRIVFCVFSSFIAEDWRGVVVCGQNECTFCAYHISAVSRV